MSHRERAVLSIVLAAMLVAGCATNAGPRAVSSPPAAGTQAPGATARPTPMPGEPGASIRVLGEVPIAGTLGSWAIDGAGSDAPWLPARALAPLDVAADAVISVAFDDGAPIGSFTGLIASVADVRGESPSRLGGRESAVPPLGAVSLGPLPSGAWVLAVQLVRADARGEATFYWSVRVP